MRLLEQLLYFVISLSIAIGFEGSGVFKRKTLKGKKILRFLVWLATIWLFLELLFVLFKSLR